MSTLGDIENIENHITHAKLPAIKALHIICFGNEGESRKARKALRMFSGFGWDKNSDDHTAKIQDVSDKLKLPDLIAVCNILGLDYEGSFEEVANRVCSFLITLEYEENSGEENDESCEDESDDDSEEEEEEEIPEDSKRKTKRNIKRECFSLTFRDVEDSIRPFDGKDDYPVRTWIEDFEEVAEVTGWNDLQKLIFAKKSLKGLAKLYVQSQKGIKTWYILKKRLLKEFEVKVSSAQIHKILMTRKKRFEESVQEYILTMREIGSRANIEAEVIIQYIIDGIQDESANKVILYGAKSFHEFKEKAKLYESITKRRLGSGNNHFKTKKDKYEGKMECKKEKDVKMKKSSEKGKPEICFNCGSRGHKSKDCPDKNKGRKCFSCNRFGHLSSQCPDKASTSTEKPHSSADVNTIDVVPKNAVTLTFGETKLLALFDTGSDISVVRQDIYELYFSEDSLSQDTITVRGIGTNRVKTLGSFSRNVEVNGEEFNLLFHVIPKEASNFQVIVGRNLLKEAEVHIRDDGIVVCKKENNFLMSITVDENKKDDEIDLRHVENKEYKEVVKAMIENYEPQKRKTSDSNIKMKIILKNEEPIYQGPRRLSLPEKEEVEKQIHEWLKDGIIRESSSDFASPIVLVYKKDGAIRICCDYRKLNRNIVKDRFPLPLIEDVLDRLEGAKIFSTIDLKNGFFHVDVEESSIKYTSFVTHNGQYEFLKCPFGLCNSPAVFQRYISTIFRTLSAEGIVIFYMDDLIIPSRTIDEGIERLRRVLEVARENGLEIRKKKCQFLKRRVQFLGYLVEDGKVQPSEEKTLAIKRFPEPTTHKQLQSYLGLTGYFRKFIPSYSTIAKPLSDMLRKEMPFQFGDKQRHSFEKLKELLTCYPVLHIFQRGLPTELHTDASKHGYGACLMQKSNEDSKMHPVYFLSKKTTPAEEKYSSYELEVLAVITAVKKFRTYILGMKIKIVTDCLAFQKTMQKKDLTTRVARWALLLEEYDYEIEHRQGSRMSHVDALSRYPEVMTMTEEDGLLEKIRVAQGRDEHIATIKKLLDAGKEHEDYFTKHAVVYKYANGRELLVIPKAMQTEIIKRAHEEGHFAVRKTEEVVEREYFIPRLKEKIQTVIANCIPCILGNRKEGKKEGMLHPISKLEGPLHTYHADHLGPIPSTNKNYQYILAVTDEFTKFTWIYPTKSTTAKETINCLVKQQKTFGNPSRIITDKGTAFTAKEFEEFCNEEGIKHLTITTGVPRGNGQVERINRTIIPVLTKLSINDPTKWFKFVDRVQRALNSTFQRSIKTTPFEAMTGVKMKRKEDIELMELIEEEARKQFDEGREHLREECKKQLIKIQEENRKNYNKGRKKATTYKEGDLVAIKRTQFGSGLKIHKKFLGPYEVIQVKRNDRYDVMKIGSQEGPIRTSTCAEYMKPWVQYGTESESDS